MRLADRPFVDRPPGELAAAARLAARVAADLGLPEPALLKVGMNAIYVAGAVVIRVGRPTAPGGVAYELVRALRSSGIRAPRPVAGDVVITADGDDAQPLVATLWERLRPTSEEPDWCEVGRMVRRVNELDQTVLPPGYPTPWCSTFPWWQFDALLAEIDGDIDGSALAELRKTVDAHRHILTGSDDAVLCHGDVHPGNVVATADGPVIIDWDLLCVGPVAWEHAPLLSMVARWGTPPSAYTRFADGYGADLAADPAASALCELRLVSATIMRVLAGREDPADRAEAERRLAWWRGERDAPIWAPA